jgi:hypothetical protein
MNTAISFAQMVAALLTGTALIVGGLSYFCPG